MRAKDKIVRSDVYLCVSETGYVHCVFDTMETASTWCSYHHGYHVIIRPLMFYPGDVK